MSGEILWTPSADRIEGSTLARYQTWLYETRGIDFENYAALWKWSTTELTEFWASIWEFFDVRAHTPYDAVLGTSTMPGAQWFTGATLNYAEHALRHSETAGTAVVGLDESGARTTLSWPELRGQVGAVATWLTEHGVTVGDRVVGYLPNVPEAVVAFLACASIGAVWSACSPEYSATGAADRLGQLDPVVLFIARSYRYGGTVHDRSAAVAELRERIPGLRAVVDIGDGQWADIVAHPSEPDFTAVDFDHPLWVLYSSGTTGKPKGIVHSHGGVLLEHLKYLGLHADLGAGDRFWWYASTSWVMWNLQVSGLLLGATIVTYDGSPSWPDADRAWRIAGDERLTAMGTSAAYLLSSQRAGLRPADSVGLASLKYLGSTGSPLPPSGFEWVYDAVSPDVWLASQSGGTDIASAFATGIPGAPVRSGEIQARALGVAMYAWDPDANELTDTPGELVVTQPMPSMPVFFWNDPDGDRYRAAYFDAYPGVWRHGDSITITMAGGIVVHGRSDATMNRLGVRIGSADIYDVVERMPEVGDALVVGVELPDGGYWMPLFVQLAGGAALDDNLVRHIRSSIRTHASPRHVPDEVISVPALPRTLTGKRLEIPIKRILQGLHADSVVNSASLTNPHALDWFARLAAARASKLTPARTHARRRSRPEPTR